MAKDALVKAGTPVGGILRPWHWYKQRSPFARIAIPFGLAIAFIGGAWTVLNEGEYGVALLLVVLFLLFGIQAVRETAWSRRAKWIVSLILVVIAAYSGALIVKKASDKGWSVFLTPDEKVERQEVPIVKKKPELQGEILQSAFLHAHTGESHIWLQVRVYNTGEPTIVRGWRLRGHSPKFNIDRQPTEIDKAYIYDGDTAAPYEGRIEFHPSDGVYEKAVNDPLSAGEDLAGWLLYIVRDVHIDDLAAVGAEYKITVLDYMNNSFDLTVFKVSGEPYAPQYYPGGGRPRFRIKPRIAQPQK